MFMSPIKAALAAEDARCVTLGEIIGAFTYALDLTEGQPEGHCLRCCWIGMQVGRTIGLPEASLGELYYALLLKDAGCSSNAARVCALYLADDREFKRDYKLVDSGSGAAMRFVLDHTGLQSGLLERYRTIFKIFRNGSEIARELTETRCQRGADIARQLHLSEGIAAGIHNLDEHWDGSGLPSGLRGAAIPIYSQIALLTQVFDVFHQSAGPTAAIEEIKRRANRWFDPELVRALVAVAAVSDFWIQLASTDLDDHVFALEPGRFPIELSDGYLDDIVMAFGQVVDAKSPFTAGHSSRVAHYADSLCLQLGLAAEHRQWIRRAAAMHDIGKLGVSNSVLDKPGKLEGNEWTQMMDHTRHTAAILSRSAAFGDMADIAAAHHERLDGKGYPYGLAQDRITLETRIISVADFFDALTADRPYRSALPVEKALDIMRENVGNALDPVVFAALLETLDTIVPAKA